MATPDPSNPDLAFSAAATDLGQGWKVRPFIKSPAQHHHHHGCEWPRDNRAYLMASMEDFSGNGRATVLRFYWDGETDPSIEVPMTDFFAIGNDRFAPVNSLAVVDIPKSSMNCYWPMPFRRHARITVTNDSDKVLPLLPIKLIIAWAPYRQRRHTFTRSGVGRR